MNPAQLTACRALGVLSLLIASVPVTAQMPMSTALTYQGQIKRAGVPLSGTADLEFSLWDGPGTGDPPTGGNQIGMTVRRSDVAVTNGLFTVEVDFGAGRLRTRKRAGWRWPCARRTIRATHSRSPRWARGRR